MGHLNRILEVIGLTLTLLVLTGILFTDAYSRGAQAEARGYDTLTHLIAHDADPLTFNEPHTAANTRAQQAAKQ